MSDVPVSATPPLAPTLVVKNADLNITAPEFVPKQTKMLIEFAPKLLREDDLRRSGGSGLPESASTEGINVSAASEDLLSTPTPTSISSFTQLVKSARVAMESEPQSDVSMLSMTDDDSEISSADISITTEPKTPIISVSNPDQDDLDVSPTGGIGGGVRCGIQKPAQPASTSTATSTEPVVKENRFKEGLVLQNEPHKPKYRPFPPQRSCNVHIQNLPDHYGDAELSALCEEFGHIVSVRVLRRPVAAPPNRRLPEGQHSTYGFVLFDTVISAENCVNTLRRRYKNIYPSFARQVAPAVHQPAFVGLLEAMAFGDLNDADPSLDAYSNLNPGLGGSSYCDPAALAPVYAPSYDAPVFTAPVTTHVQPAFEQVFEVNQPTLVSAPLEANQVNPTRPRALTIKPMPPPIQSYVAPSTTTDRLNSVLNEASILLIVDGLPKDFGVGLLDTLFAPHPIHDVRLHRKGTAGAVRGSVRVLSRAAALQSIEKLTGMQFGGLASGLQVRLAEEVPGANNDSDSGAAPGLPSYHTLPDVQEYQAMLAPPVNSILASSTSAPAVASMIGSGLNALLFTSETRDGLALAAQGASSLQVSPSTGRLLASPARLQVPITPPGLSNSVSMPHVAPRFLGQPFGMSPALRVGNVMLPISNILPSDSLYACSNVGSTSRLDKLPMQPTPEPPVIKVTSYASAVKKPIVTIDPPKDGADGKKKRKNSRAAKARAGKSDDSKSSPETMSKAVMDKPATDKSTTSSPTQPKSSKTKKGLGTRRRANSKSTATKVFMIGHPPYSPFRPFVSFLSGFLPSFVFCVLLFYSFIYRLKTQVHVSFL